MIDRLLALTASPDPLEAPIATLTIRDLPDDVRDRLRVRAAQHGRSMESEVRAILLAAVTTVPVAEPTWMERLREIFVEPDDPATGDETDPQIDWDALRREGERAPSSRSIPFRDLSDSEDDGERETP